MYGLNPHYEPVLMAGPKHFLTEVGIHHRLKCCVTYFGNSFLACNFFKMVSFQNEMFDPIQTWSIQPEKCDVESIWLCQHVPEVWVKRDLLYLKLLGVKGFLKMQKQIDLSKSIGK